MGFNDGLRLSGHLTRIALALVCAAAFFNWIAFTTTSWGIIEDTSTSGDDTHIGIWRRCQKKTHACYSLFGYANIWYGCFQALSIIAFVGCNLSLLLTLLFMFWDGCKRNKELGHAAAATCVLSAGIWLIAVIVFWVKYLADDNVSGANNKQFGFCRIIAIFAAVLEASAGGFLLIQALHGKKYKQGEEKDEPGCNACCCYCTYFQRFFDQDQEV